MSVAHIAAQTSRQISQLSRDSKDKSAGYIRFMNIGLLDKAYSKVGVGGKVG